VNQQIRDERREQILQVAAKMIAQKGIASIKIGELADAAEMSQGLLYRYFPSKEEVFITLVEQVANTLMQPMKEALLSTAETASQRLFELTRKMLNDLSLYPDRHQLLWQALALPGQTNEIVYEMGRYMKGTLRQLIVEGQNEGEIRREYPDKLVVLYLSTLQE
jgi:AcrR family transcriptional regulator